MSDNKVHEGVLFGMGNPLLDISAHVSTDVLTKYGLTANLAILAEPKHVPLYQELVDNHDVEYIAGGATQNSIRVAQWILGLPQATTYVGCIGKDSYGKKLRECAEGHGVRVAYLEDETTPTGTCACLVTGRERTLVANISAANMFKIAHLETASTWSLVEKAEVFYISSFFLTVSPPSALKVAQYAADHNKIFTMNLAAPFLSQFFKDPLMQLAPFWDFIFGNETEAEAFATANDFGTKDIKEIATKMAAMPKTTSRPRVVVITQGALPTVVFAEGKIHEYPVQLLKDEEIVDTNGAGDAFVGGFLAQLVKGKSLEECVRCGQWAARVIIQRSGCTYPDVCSYQ
eukprot:m.42757 g.42757  ORF g.42757 m.42757 type:complete len:345 (+) comp12136_c0_seq2:79-1113(+)